MKLRRIALVTTCLVTCFLSCNKDDGGTDPVVVEDRDRTEQQIADKEALLDYFKTHYYNSSEFEALANPTIQDLKITKLVEGTDVPDDGTLLEDAMGVNLKTVQTSFADTDYEYYILRLEDGNGIDSPTFGDNVVATYEGFTLDNAVFDSAINPIGFDLTGTIIGWGKVFSQFNVAEDFNENGDGTVSFVNQGMGVMFLPSGLGYFSESRTGIPAYSPLIFKFELLQTSQNDHDNDGIPSYLEDADGNGDLFDNTDEDFTSAANGFLVPIYNYQDTDDDGDGILTRDEITITTENRATREAVKSITLESNQKLVNYIVEEEDGTFTGTIITFTDTDGDGTPDYLDSE
ncbi:FKBP-type peptidyl-prolyl cis-trans isomerase [Flavivirga algicola]|uniref:peptidylprolyl isomerase n=1 Tax=Flavivirga algicola TaxID=2729136 RepID=A0ABX1RVG4_9FLAO|nr:hypothetical protein [Flavivirga algicola]NMH86437.1 hypothetical protein [Flavivirga algicola]